MEGKLGNTPCESESAMKKRIGHSMAVQGAPVFAVGHPSRRTVIIGMDAGSWVCQGFPERERCFGNSHTGVGVVRLIRLRSF